jgi:5-aminolevulinate synthase
MTSYLEFFKNSLDDLKNDGRYRIFVDLKRHAGQAPYALWDDGEKVHRIIIWCTNDYLNMSHHPEIIEKSKRAIEKYGVGSGGTRNISGSCHAHVELEKLIATLHEKEAGLIFNSGYAANETTLATLGQHLPDCVILSDEKNHASMIQGIRLARCEKRIFKHNNLNDLEDHLKSMPLNRAKIIAFVSVYSMDGDMAPIEKICDLAEKYNALTFLDEVHAVGLYGKKGEGIAGMIGQNHRIDIMQGNFAKAYGVVGGYIAGKRDTVDFIRSHAPGFIFTTSLPPAVAVAAHASVSLLMRDQTLRDKHQENIRYLKERLAKTSVHYIDNHSHIVPVIIGNAKACRTFSHTLLKEYGMYAQPINYPTVPMGQERLRIIVTPQHTKEMIDQLIHALDSMWQQMTQEKKAA